MIPWNNPKFGKKELELVNKVLDTGYVSEGPMTKELEEKLSKIVNAKHVIMTTSCTAALYLAIEADKRIRNYNKGTVVIPNLTFLATKQAVELANLNVQVEDVANNNFILQFAKYGLPHPRIVIPVNLLGRSIKNYSSNLTTVIMDNAGCLGSNVPNGKVGCYSLQANKLLSCGQGGFCATDDDEYAKVIRQLKDFGRESKYDQDTKGFNFKFNDIQAAVALGQLQQLNKRKNLHLRQYNKYLNELDDYGVFIKYEEGEIPLWVEFLTPERDELYEYLKSNGVDARMPWKPLVQSSKYPNTNFYCDNCLWLPNGSNLKPKDLNKVIKLIKKYHGN